MTNRKGDDLAKEAVTSVDRERLRLKCAEKKRSMIEEAWHGPPLFNAQGCVADPQRLVAIGLKWTYQVNIRPSNRDQLGL